MKLLIFVSRERLRFYQINEQINKNRAMMVMIPQLHCIYTMISRLIAVEFVVGFEGFNVIEQT